jgi:hypothetical protein
MVLKLFDFRKVSEAGLGKTQTFHSGIFGQGKRRQHDLDTL